MAKFTQAREAEVAELLAAMGQLVRRLRAEARTGELSWGQNAIMGRLEAGPMTTAQMEQEGLVRRKAHPTDGRQILYELTAAGLQGRYKSRLAKREWLLSAIAGLEREEQRKLFKAIEVIKRLAES